MDDQISAVVKKCYFHIRNISKIRKFINVETSKILVTNLLFSQLDYCNGLPKSSLSRLKRVQNCAARLILFIRKSAYITPAFIELHWLPIDYLLKFKILLQIFKVINGKSSYLSDLIQKHEPSRTLRSSNANLLYVPRSYSKFGDRKFSQWRSRGGRGGASGETRPGAQALGAQQHTFCSHFKRVLSRNLDQRIFWKKTVKFISASGTLPPNPNLSPAARGSVPSPLRCCSRLLLQLCRVCSQC